MKSGEKLNVLIACESSATVRDEFRKLGHNAWSCDLLPCDGDPRYHYQGDIMHILTMTKLVGGIPGMNLPKKWDLLIGHPPCTYLCNSGVRWLTWRCRPAMRADYDRDRWAKMEEAAAFFMSLLVADIPYIAIENPIPHKYGKLPRYTQIIQPWQFGHGETKATCLWLRNLPKLVPTDVVAGREHRIHMMPPGPQRWKERSKTFVGIARAMAQQWSAHIIAEKQKGNETKTNQSHAPEKE